MRSRSQDLVEKIAFRHANAIVVNSSAVREYLQAARKDPNKICTIYNGINTARFDPGQNGRQAICEKHRLPSNENVRFVTMVANLRHAVKNVPMLLRTAKHVLATRPDIRFIIAGEGELKTSLEKSAQQSGIADKVHFIGACEDVSALIRMSHVCVLTSTAEGFSNSLLEYMAAGKPVVATNVGGASEAIVEGKTGFLIPANDDQAMARRVIELLDDDFKANAFGAEGRRVVAAKFSSETQLRSTIDLYRSLLN